VRTATALLLLPLLPFLTAFEPLKSSNKDVEQGNLRMKAGKAEEALSFYDKAVAALPNDPGVHFDRGTALYALSRFDEAGQEFLRATEAKDTALKASAFYNLGNAFSKKEKFQEALEAYKRALTLDPHDARAKWNTEIALQKKKEEEKKKKDQQDKNKGDKNKDDKNKDDPNKGDQNKKDDQKEKKDQKTNEDGKDKNKDKKDQNKNDQDKQNPKDKQDHQNQKDKPGEQPPPPKADEQEIGAVLDSLERDPKDLEKERARLRAVRRRPPAKDW
jgi:Ca-activated chloride channel homolog